MKKLIFPFTIIAISVVFMIVSLAHNAFAGGLSNSYNQVKETVTEYGQTKSAPCAPSSDTPFQDVERADIDLIFKLGVIDSPGGGRFDFYFLENWDVTVNLNLGTTFYVYSTYSQRSYKIAQASDAIYEQEFKMTSLTGGAGLYVFPTLKVFAGAGKIITIEDSTGTEPKDLGTFTEVGAAYDYAWNRNKVVAGVKMVTVSSEAEETTAAENDGNPSHITGFIGLSVPFMR